MNKKRVFFLLFSLFFFSSLFSLNSNAQSYLFCNLEENLELCPRGVNIYLVVDEGECYVQTDQGPRATYLSCCANILCPDRADSGQESEGSTDVESQVPGSGLGSIEEGDPCESHDDCISNFCNPNYNVCDNEDSGTTTGSASQLGEACQKHDDCISNFCDPNQMVCSEDYIGEQPGDEQEVNECEPGTIDSKRCGTTDVPVCSYGTQERRCNEEGEWEEWSGCSDAIYPSTEVCDGSDNNCNGAVDEGCDCVNGDTKPCGQSTGECQRGQQTCENGEWSTCRNNVGPRVEVCDGKDNDCDGQIDENDLNEGDYTLKIECNMDSCSGTMSCSPSGMGQCVLDNDADSDGICDELDNCPLDENPDQMDSDGAGAGDACDICPNDVENDIDEDGICGNLDNCPDDENANQEDSDGDGIGDVCDICPNDSKNGAPDYDGICGNEDNCPNTPNPEQKDCDEDGIGDACDTESLCSTDSDNDNINDNLDNCPNLANPNQEDEDGDNMGDACDNFPKDPFNDIDDDSVSGNEDNCPDSFNPSQLDDDNDGIGNACDLCRNDELNDIDADNYCGNVDNCPKSYNPSQSDCDNDGIGNACDYDSECSSDSDQDNVLDVFDNCPDTYNPKQRDVDNDRIGDDCDFCTNDPFNDEDKDGICGNIDNCPLTKNHNQKDSDFDGIGDVCDICRDDEFNDVDKDGICGNIDNCPFKSNLLQIDCDNDGIGDACDTNSLCNGEIDNDGLENIEDNCVESNNPYQTDRDGDGIGDACDKCSIDPLNDIDNDGVCGDIDNCPTIKNQYQFDSDKDGKGNSCDKCINDPDNDKDSDLICGNLDNCPSVFNPGQFDCDNNGIGDTCDTESNCVESNDGDELIDYNDNCPELYNPNQTDTDNDGIGDLCDVCVNDKLNDVDQDGICGNIDNCPVVFNPSQKDDDGDNLGNVCDLCPDDANNDIDEDSICGNIDNCPKIHNPNQESCNEVIEQNEKFDEVIQIKQEQLDSLLEKNFLNVTEEKRSRFESGAESIKQAIKFEKKEYMRKDKKFTRYRISVAIDEPINDFTYYQNIPKCLAERADNIYFNGRNYHVLERDPLITWHFANVEETLEITYEVEGVIDDECLAQIRDFAFSPDYKAKTKPFQIIVPLLFILIIVIGVVFYEKHYSLKKDKMEEIIQSKLTEIEEKYKTEDPEEIRTLLKGQGINEDFINEILKRL